MESRGRVRTNLVVIVVTAVDFANVVVVVVVVLRPLLCTRSAKLAELQLKV